MAGNTVDKLTPKQDQALLALLKEPTVELAAKAAGVGERTLFRWLEEPVFRDAYRKARREAFKHAISLTQKYLPHAIQTLVQIMADKSAPHSARVSASNSLMKFSRDSIELDDVVERVERLEQAPDPRAPSGDGSVP